MSSVGQVVIPAAVVEELDVLAPHWSSNKPDWLQIVTLTPASADTASAWETSGILHRGEAHSVALARQIAADWYLTDDSAARIFAESVGIEAHGTVGIVLWAAISGLVSREDTEALLDRLAHESSLWVSQRVLSAARSALDDLWSS